MQVLQLIYIIGVYDPGNDDSWPWHCQYEYGRYLSAKHRICGRERAAEFSTEEEARDFYYQWKQARKFKFELIPVQFWVTGRVENRLAPVLPHQTVHALLTHTAFRCSSHQGMRCFPASLCRNLV